MGGRIACLILALMVTSQGKAQERPVYPLKEGERIVVLGDSITYAGHYITYLDAYLSTRFPDKQHTLLNLGLPSETVSGLTEEGHPYPRPCVLDRLDRVLKETRPTLVVACYGMNDGIYSPLNPQRFEAYKNGIRKLVATCQASGARVVLLTPPPFDPLPIRTKVRQKNAQDFSFKHPYGGYDDVLGRYSNWLVLQRRPGVFIVDVHTALDQYVDKVREFGGLPDYSLSKDGVHLNPTGHWLITHTILYAWNLPTTVDRVDLNVATQKARVGKVTDIKTTPTGARFSWTTRIPMPYDPKWDPVVAKSDLAPSSLNVYPLCVRGLSEGEYTLLEKDQSLGRFSAVMLRQGIDMAQLESFKPNRQRATVHPLFAERQQILARAWMTHVGHQRPKIPKGLPLQEAQQQAARITEKIQQLTKPVPVSLELRRIEDEPPLPGLCQ